MKQKIHLANTTERYKSVFCQSNLTIDCENTYCLNIRALFSGFHVNTPIDRMFSVYVFMFILEQGTRENIDVYHVTWLDVPGHNNDLAVYFVLIYQLTTSTSFWVCYKAIFFYLLVKKVKENLVIPLWVIIAMHV